MTSRFFCYQKGIYDFLFDNIKLVSMNVSYIKKIKLIFVANNNAPIYFSNIEFTKIISNIIIKIDL